MNKVWFWIVWGLAFLVTNLSALPIAAFILYGAEADAGIFSVSFMKLIGLFLLMNLITLQMFVAGRKRNKAGFMVGLTVAFLQAASLIVFMSTISTAAVIIAMIVFVAAAVLLVMEIRRRAY
ncbi:hypothetical protein [Bacillus badius]|uniref:Uncharacterized protein n=1 Tax=Bacillus badius TaxID=1455 RepID=A0ABR5ATT8_BACBA|nr:hypothetical protein [Bacillus badius]KIL72810.1 hypothetical protein SD78_3981 [Bacillus badius]KIL78172.1 hypothetical protein SD77_0773 [Bacillus badius]MED4718335.1 hypothetical protein [Bacillus badius]